MLARNGKEFNEMMSERSPAFKKALAENKSITVQLNACNIASQEYMASDGKVYKDNTPIAKDISNNLPNGSKVIAPNGYIMFNGKRGYRKVLESNKKFLNTGKGGFLTIVDGKVISKRQAPYKGGVAWQQIKPKPKEE